MVFTFEGFPYGLTIGRELTVSNNLKNNLESAVQQKIDCIAAPIFHPHLNRDKLSIEEEIEPLAKADLLLEADKWTRHVIGKLSTEINLDSPYSHINDKSKFYLKQELNYAIHLGVGAFIVPSSREKFDNYARVLNKFLLRGTGNTQIWMRFPLSEDETSWEKYNAFRLRLQNTSGFGACLEIGSDLPEDNIIRRWMGEDIKAIVLQTNIFMNDDAGNPILSKKHETLMKILFPLRMIVLIKAQTNSEDVTKYREYLTYLFATQPPIQEIQYIQYRFNDILQEPLQPLRDNLESQCYAHFEKDTVKYEYYEMAIYQALKENFLDQERIVIMVIGAGRAPLVKACFKAADELKRKVFVYAIEKNPNAIITINSIFPQKNADIKSKLAVVSKDVRTWNPPEQADILFSELLGSFADNELSPEILDWSQRLLKPEGLNIPYEYSAFLTPISYPSIHNKLKNSKEAGRQLETPHVVKLERHYAPCEVKKCFTFNHPRTDAQKNNKRFQSLEFEFKESNTIHGFGGYFEGMLYKDVCISINPETLTKNLYSWFPIYFPFEKSLSVTTDTVLKINVWRLTSNKRVWYEWQAEVLSRIGEVINCTKIHNSDGHSYSIDL